MEASASEFEDRELAEALKRSKSEAPSTSAASAAGSSADPKLTILPTDNSKKSYGTIWKSNIIVIAFVWRPIRCDRCLRR